MKKSLKILLIVLTVLCILFGGGWILANRAVDKVLDNVEQGETIDNTDAAIATEVEEAVIERNVVNFLLLGCDNNGKGYYSSTDRSDAIKVVSLDFDNKKIKIGNLERDVVVYAPGDYQGFLHLNWAYWFGGTTLAVQTVNYNFDLDITKYVVISFDALEKIVDAVGGIDITLTSSEAYALNAYVGENHLNGSSAMRYCRLRSIDSDFVRVERQNVVIKAVLNKLKNSGVQTILDVMNTVLPCIKTNLSTDEIKDLIYQVITFDLVNIDTYTEPTGEYNDICNCPGLGGYLVRSYVDMAKHLHEEIYGEDFPYKPSQTLIDNEKLIYKTYGDFSKD